MKKLFLVTSFLFTFVFCFSQIQRNSDSLVLISTKGDTINIGDDKNIFIKAEVESEFPGGLRAWQYFLLKNLKYPPQAVRKQIQGTVVLQFIVCADGTVCNLEAISGPDILRKAALEAIQNTPNWNPAVQDGRKVKSYKKQPITFRLG